ncbi:MAG: hypothetical protein H0X42_14250 [Solirubrobacterales bacterium]|nr:hypothetical protein [Solirubrobacterales bacterium]
MASIACITVPRFALVAACGQSRVSEEALVLISGRGSNALIAETSRRAEDAGVQRGMRRAQALGLCGELRLANPDPAAAQELWEQVLARLEGIGAEVEAGRPGEAFFDAAALRGLYGGSVEGVLRAARAAVTLRVRAALAPTRFGAFIAAVIDRRRAASSLPQRGERILGAPELGAFLSDLPVSALAVGPGLEEQTAAMLVEVLERMGIETLGAFAKLTRAQVADRFGSDGLLAQDLARGRDRRLRPRHAVEELREDLEMPDGAAAGAQLEIGMEIVVSRLVDQPQRKGRTILAVRLSARLESGGSWTTSQTLGMPTSSAKTIAALLKPKLDDLPSPPSSLSIRASAFGPPAAEQLQLPDSGREGNQARLAEKIRQLRALQGPGVVEVESDSRIPER